MRIIYQTATRIVLVTIAFTACCIEAHPTATAQTIPAEQQSTTIPDLLALKGKVVELVYIDGRAQWPLTITQIEEGKTPGTLKYIKVRFEDQKRQRKVNASKISDIIVDHQPLDVRFDRDKRGLVHDPEKRQKRMSRLAEVEAKLKEKRFRLWEPLTDQADAGFLERQKKTIEETKSALSNLNFRVVETEYFIVCTDLLPAQIDGYLASLDLMYKELCLAFGIPPARKIWCGKCLVFAFSRQLDFQTFEKVVMKNDDPDIKAQGLCHQFSNGRVLFAGYRGQSDEYFGSVLVHETAHGFVHRYLSSARAPSWLNEGMSDWIAHAVMKTDAIPRKQIQSANRVRSSGTWSDFLTTKHIDFKLYGAASTMVEILLRRDKGGQFREFFRGIKEGKAAEESLKDTFGLSYKDLEILYAEQLLKIPERLPR
jgi:hypothetical protein